MVGSDGKRVIPFQDIGNEILKSMLSNDRLSFMLEGRQREFFTWHPFPQDKPPTNTWYLVTFSDNMDGSGLRGISMMYYTKKGYFDDYSFGVTERTVVAWAELPKPYGEVTASDTDSDIK